MNHGPFAESSGRVARRQPPEAEVLLLCARPQVQGPSANRVAECCQAPGFRWSGLASLARAHDLAPLVLTHVLDIAGDRVPRANLLRWRSLKARSVLAKARQFRLAREIIEWLGSRGARVMLLKGVALDAVLYAEPWYTRSTDVDLMVDRPFLSLTEDDRETLRTLCATRPIELDFMRHHDVDMNDVLDIDYARVWAQARPVVFQGVPAYVMTPEDQLLSVCVNLCRKRYRMLKGMMAVRELIRAHEAFDWAAFVANANGCGGDRIAYAALRITDDVLGCDVPSNVWRDLEPAAARRWGIDRLCRELASRLFALPAPAREPAARLLTSGLLRFAAYHTSQYWREVRGIRRLRAHLSWVERGGASGPASPPLPSQGGPPQA